MGGLIALHWLLSGGGKDLRGLALSSPLLGVAVPVPAWKAKLGTVMSNVYPKLALPSGLAGRDVSRDPEQARSYDADPLNNKNATARWYTEMLAATVRVQARASELQLPTLLLYGGDDKVASPEATDRLAAVLSMPDRTIERLAGYYHELVNEPEAERNAVIERYRAWFIAHKA
jgi:alpha-beta hydrolase superfamily lysophospholipase